MVWRVLILSLWSLLLAGCGASLSPGAGVIRLEDSASPAGGSAAVGRAEQGKTTGSFQASATAVYLDGQPIRWQDLHHALVESGGGGVLTEVVLDRLIEQRLEEHGLGLTPEHIANERVLLVSTLDPTDADRAQRLLGELRLGRGLGKHRFKKMLARNAGLRLLIQDQVKVSPAAIDQAYQYEYGPRHEARLIVADSLKSAADLVKRAQAGESFIDLAIAHSIDPSKAQGGLIGPISLVDPTFPKAVRVALTMLKPGEVSAPVALEKGFAVLRLERIIPPQAVDLDTVKEDLTRRVRRRVERMLMQRLARTMLNEADVVVLDPLLHTSWENHRRRPPR